MAKRELPWRKTRDPHTIWVSEIILQQTRVEQGTPYFERFIEAFPNIASLANAPEDHVLALWQGLGYYSRARNMQAAARQVMDDYAGEFPTNYEDILKLKGIGPYTAAAISSICFDEPEPVVDGNVFRAASRIFGIHDDISKESTRKIFVSTLKAIIPSDQPGTFNQAMMELGATICKPSPICGDCPVREFCQAIKSKTINQLPVKGKKTKVRDRYLNYLVYQSGGKVLMKKREGKDIWHGLYDFPLIEGKEIEKKTIASSKTVSSEYIHILSHQRLHARFYLFEPKPEEMTQLARTYDAKPYSLKQVLTLPKPKLVVNYLDDTSGLVE
jgi:A/G-specific adenine glycosylase